MTFNSVQGTFLSLNNTLFYFYWYPIKVSTFTTDLENAVDVYLELECLWRQRSGEEM